MKTALILPALVAMALGAVAATPAAAQTSSVSLFGNIFISVRALNDLAHSGIRSTQLESNTSRMGIQGVESLGGGQKAIFHIESIYFADAGGGSLAGWEDYAGLQGDWGTVKFGKMFLPYTEAQNVFDDNVFRDNLLTSGTLWANSGMDSLKNGSYNEAYPNAVRYESPVLGDGFRVDGGAAVAEGDDHNHDYTVSGGLFYKAHGFDAALAAQYNRGYRYEGVNDYAVTAALSYDFGFFKIAGVYEHLQYEHDAQSEDKLKRDFFGAGVTVPLGRGSLFGFYGYARDGKGDVDGECVGDFCVGDDTGAQQFTIAYSYPLSKRTSVYAGYIYIDNDKNADYTFYRDGWRNTTEQTVSIAPGSNQQGISIGIAHSF